MICKDTWAITGALMDIDHIAEPPCFPRAAKIPSQAQRTGQETCAYHLTEPFLRFLEPIVTEPCLVARSAQ